MGSVADIFSYARLKTASIVFNIFTSLGEQMKKPLLAISGLLSLAIPGSNAIAAQVTSSDFSIGYGFSESAIWSTSETADANTDITGPFSLTISPHAFNYVGSGITFPNRVPTNGGPGLLSAAANNGGPGGAFVISVSANYNGLAPADAAAVPNYRIEIEITSISIYAGANASLISLAFTETTDGHNQSQADGIALIDSGNDFSIPQGNVSSYRKLTWNPDTYSVGIDAANDDFSRIFSTNAPSSHVVFLDGFEIEGRVHFHYDVVPEPGSLVAMGMVAAGLIGRRRIH